MKAKQMALEWEWLVSVDAEMAWWRTRWFFDRTGVVVIDRPTHGVEGLDEREEQS